MITIHKERAENITSYIKDIRELQGNGKEFLARNIKASWDRLLLDEFLNNGIKREDAIRLLDYKDVK